MYLQAVTTLFAISTTFSLSSSGQEVLGRRLGSLQEKTQQELGRVQERIKENMAEERRACQVREPVGQNIYFIGVVIIN